eukprot:PITA_32749
MEAQGHDPPSSPAEDAFNHLLAGLPPKKRIDASKFVKKLDEIPEISLPPETPMQFALSLADRGLIGQFTGLWPSPKTTEQWVNRNWAPLINESVTSYFLGRGFFLFEFTSKEDKDLIFRNGQYFMGPQGLVLNKWTPDFDPAVDVPKAVPVWVRLPNLPVHCWNWDSLKHIGNSLGKFIDRASNKDQYDCARICVELSFKCRKCHVYGHFARNCPTNPEPEKGKEEGWNQVKRARANHRGPKQGGPPGKGNFQGNVQKPPTKKVQENKFILLSQPTEGTPEVENQKPESSRKSSIPASPREVENLKVTAQEDEEEDPSASLKRPSPKGMYTEEEEEEEQQTEESEEEGEIGESHTSVRRSTRGRKTDREKREQETYKEKLQGSQPTLEKMLASKPKILKNPPQGSKGAHPKYK